MMKTLYLIGGSGFIGKNLIDGLEKKYQIYVIDKYIDTVFFSSHPEVKTIQIDLENEQVPVDLPSPNYIINLASIVTAERDFSLFDTLIASNLKVLLNLYHRFKDDNNLKLFVQFGSSEEYGTEHSPFVETMREVPCSPYALVKQLTVNAALMLCRNYNFPAMAVRPGNLFGKYQNKTKFIPYMIGQLKQHLPLKVTPCEQKRDFIYAQDFVCLIDGILLNANRCIGEILNVSSGQSVSLKSVLAFCKGELGSSSVVEYGAIPYRNNEVMDLRCSIEKLENIVGHEIRLDLYQRLKEYIKSV